MASSKKPDSFPPIETPEDIDKIITYFKELFGRDITAGERNYLKNIRKKLELKHTHASDQTPSPHPEIKWHDQTQEWHCIKCGRTSDHIREDDAWVEINTFACAPPTAPEGDECDHW